MSPTKLRRQDYTIGWVCALDAELAATRIMLDEEHPPLDQAAGDTNLYTLGRIGYHNVVIACLPAGQIGTNSAAAVATQIKASFKSVQLYLMVGVGGGVPGTTDIRLGDVVVSQPQNGHGGVVQYDFGKTIKGRLKRTGFLSAPSTMLLNAVVRSRSNHLLGKSSFQKYISCFESLPAFSRNNTGPDILFEADYNHAGGASCQQCSKHRIMRRDPRRIPLVHYGTIASGNQVMRDGRTRDRISSDFQGVLCFEMEAAGLMNNFQCLVIRGISDYSDSHKNDRWRTYAAGTAAACAKDILEEIPVVEVAATKANTKITLV